ncbi:MAG: thioredoxin domain-containing protein, partial [Planctomycetota bacterium]
LLQHARNPVNWFPWGEEAFAQAKKEDKPVFLSIGYSTCHWCHVMEHESFEDELVARRLNEVFICIKVDREERPDLDHVYMTVTQAMTGRGGWPMTIVMTAEKKPFFAGTYFPKTGRYGRLGMMELIQRMEDVWRDQRAAVLESADSLTENLRARLAGTPGDGLGKRTLRAAFERLVARYDSARGGFGTAPKFPVPHNLRFLLRQHARTQNPRALEMVEKTLQEMRKGGLWDHVGYGFHRYSTDANWFLPHFEKMLYDQALLTMAYVEAWQVTGKREYERTARQILTYITRDMTSPEGGFYSAEDADSEGEEGLFYLWTMAQMRAVLGDDADLAIEVWGLEPGGNFSEEASGKATGNNHLHLDRTLEEHALERGENPAAFLARMESMRERLFAAREPRVHPLKDDKVLTDWNGLMIAAFAQAARVFDDPTYLEIARRAADHLLSTLRREDGSLYKVERLGQPAGRGLLEDYAFATWGLLELFESGQETRHLRAAVELTERMLVEFEDAENGGFFLSREGDADLIVRPKEIYDGAVPSGNSVAAWNLLRLSRLTGETRFEEAAERTFRAFAGNVRQSPGSHTQLMLGLDFAVGPTKEVVIVGDPAAEDTRAMLRALHSAWLPNKVVVLRPAGDAQAVIALVPYLADQGMLDGRATAYVCENFACQAPTNELQKLLEQLGLAEDPTGGDDEE